MDMAKLSYIATHHFGGTKENPIASTQHHTEAQVNNTHRNTWPHFPSPMRLPNGKENHIGYNFIIWRDGSWTQYRPLGSPTAAQRGFNDNTVSFALAGNFNEGSPDNPTKPQLDTYQTLGMNLLLGRYDKFVIQPGTVFNLHSSRIFPHRYFNSTSCYGTKLSDRWARDIVQERLRHTLGQLTKLLNLYQTLLLELKKRRIGRTLKAYDYTCEGSL